MRENDIDFDAFMSEVMNDPLVYDIWDRKYRYKLADGSSPEADVRATRMRVVNGVYVNDPSSPARVEAMDAVQRGLFVPAGRVNAGAGTTNNVTLINCFISETIQDSMPGIQRAIMRGALTLQGTGGLGTDWSPVRPYEALVRGSLSDACGVIPFMDQMDAMCRTIAVNDRRGALMATLRDDHPDLWNPRQFETTTNHVGDQVLKFPSFTSAKRQKGRLTQCNMSILISDAFIKAVEADAYWDLGFHLPRKDGQHIDVYDKPLPHDIYDDDNNIISVPGQPNEVSFAPLKHAKGTMMPWYVYRRVKARQIWDDIMLSTYVYAEPGVIYIDRINARNSLYYCEDIRCTNPCGEKPMPPDGICALSAINAAFLVEEPFTKHAEFNFDKWSDLTDLGVRFIDNVLDVSRYPLASQHAEAMAKRRIGLGVLGWGSALVQMGVPYGSFRSVELSRHAASLLQERSYFTSALLAKERGPFPLYDREKFMKGYNFKKLPGYVKDAIAEYGIRNGELNTIAPNGTGSGYTGNVSSAHESVYSFEPMTRKMRQRDNSVKPYRSVDYSLRLYEKMFGEVPIRDGKLDRSKLPAGFVDAMTISVDDHLAVHAAWQEFIDASISKTVNVPYEMSFDDFKKVYGQAYVMGAKGCTTYRPDPIAGRGSVLSVDAPAVDKTVEQVDKNIAELNKTIADMDKSADLIPVSSRPGVLGGMTYKLKWPVTNKNWYVTITSTNGRPQEVFITPGDPAAMEWVAALSRTVTAVLRRGGDVRFLVDQLEEVHSAAGGAFITDQQAYRPSIVAAIAGVMRQEFRRLGLYSQDVSTQAPVVEEPRMRMGAPRAGMPDGDVFTAVDTSLQIGNGIHCPQCHQNTYIKEGGCGRCLNCDYTTCG